MVRWYHVSFVAAAPALAGCGLFAGGGDLGAGDDGSAELPDGAAADGGMGGDAGGDAGKDAATDAIEEPTPIVCTKPIGACVNAIPIGWTLVAFEGSRALACPANFTSADVIASPAAKSDACSCPCTQLNAPSCATGLVTFGHGTNNCNQTSPPYAVSDNTCVLFGGGSPVTVDPYNSATKLALTPGTCLGGVPTANNAKIDATLMRGCTPPAACEEEVCEGTQPPGMRSCIAHDYDLPCPGAPFTDKVGVVGPSATITCGGCSLCSITASCPGNGVVRFYSDTNCATQSGTVTADGSCHNTGTFGAQRIKYDAPAQNVTCNPGTSTPLATTLDTPKTICCRP